MGNYLTMLCAALEEAGNFTFKKTNIVIDYGILDERTNTWNGAVSLVINNTVDIALGFFTFLPSELMVLDYSMRFVNAEFAIIIRKPEAKVLISWSAYFQVSFVIKLFHLLTYAINTSRTFLSALLDP